MKIYQPQDCIPFGKCKGESLQDIYKFNPGYIEWLIKYTDSFFIDVEDFNSLPTPTPYFVEKKHENMLWFKPQTNSVKEAKLVLKED